MSTRTRSERSEAILVSASVAAIVLVPYLTVWLDHWSALVSQAGAILAVVAGLLAVGVVRNRVFPGLRRAPRLLLLGLAAYSLAAILGAIVALVRGNDSVRMAGQLLSMGLLPLATVAGLALPAVSLRGAFALGTVSAVCLAALVHFVHWGLSLASGALVVRFYLVHAISAAGPVLLALLLAISRVSDLRQSAETRWSWPAGGAVIVLSLYVVGLGTRSLWLVLAPALLLLAVLGGGFRRHARRLLPVAVVALSLAGAAALVSLWWQAPRPDLLDPPADLEAGDTAPRAERPKSGSRESLRWRVGPGRRSVALADPLTVEPGRLYRLAAVVDSVGEGCAPVLEWLDDGGEYLSGEVARPSGRAAGVAPRAARAVRPHVVCQETQPAGSTVDRARLEEIRPAWLGLVYLQGDYLARRVLSTVDFLRSPLSSRDRNISHRLAETRTLLDEFRLAPPALRLLGHGLGAVYTLRGSASSGDRFNYIHNYYLFLLYKLGLLGTALVLAALGCWTIYPWRELRRVTDRRQQAILAAAVTAWIGYAVWNLAYPQLLDFRMAPIWGLLIAATANDVRTWRSPANSGQRQSP